MKTKGLELIVLLLIVASLSGCISDSEKAKYQVGDVVAWSDWNSESEHDGKVLGEIVEIGTYHTESYTFEGYKIRQHPWYLEPFPTNTDLTAWEYPPEYVERRGSFIDRCTELWPHEIDWSMNYVLDEHYDKAILMMNATGTYRVTKDGRLVPT